jgi:thiol-disulfide isomerase/thioredoxin
MANVGRVLALLVTLTATAHADPVQPPAIDSAITNAAVSKKPLIAEFSATWCGPCRKFESDVLPLADVQQALGDVVFVHYNAEASPGDDAASRFHVSAYPTFLVIDKQGVEVKRVAGAMSSPAFIAFLAEAKVLTTDEADVRADLRAHPKDPTVHMQAARWFASRKMATDAIREYTRVITNAGGLQADKDEAALAADRLRRQQRWRAELVADKVVLVRGSPAVVPVADFAIAVVDSGMPLADIRALTSLTLDASTDLQRTNSLIYVALAAGAKTEALEAARRLVESSRTAQFLDTLAECFHVNGQRQQALETEDEALHLGSGLDTALWRNRARFDSGVGDAHEVDDLHGQITALDERLNGVDQLPPAARTRTSPNMDAWKKAFAAQRELAQATATACAREADKVDLAFARAELDAGGRVTSAAVLLDETATPKLRACIKSHVIGATLPVANGDNKPMLMISFHH